MIKIIKLHFKKFRHMNQYNSCKLNAVQSFAPILCEQCESNETSLIKHDRNWYKNNFFLLPDHFFSFLTSHSPILLTWTKHQVTIRMSFLPYSRPYRTFSDPYSLAIWSKSDFCKVNASSDSVGTRWSFSSRSISLPACRRISKSCIRKCSWWRWWWWLPWWWPAWWWWWWWWWCLLCLVLMTFAITWLFNCPAKKKKRRWGMYIFQKNISSPMSQFP